MVIDEDDEDELTTLMNVVMGIRFPKLKYDVSHPKYQEWKQAISEQLPVIWKDIAQIIKDDNPDKPFTAEQVEERIKTMETNKKIAYLKKYITLDDDS